MIDYSKMITAADKFEQRRQAKLQAIDRERDALLTAGFEYAGHRFDSDEKSIQRINAIATLALMNAGFETPYITQNNETITLTASDIAGLGAAAAAHEASYVFLARSLKDQVLAATTQEDLDAVVWPTQPDDPVDPTES